MSATERDTFVWDVTSKLHTIKKPNVLGLYVHMDTVPEIFEKAPQIHSTSSTTTSNITTCDPILLNSNLNPLNVEKDIYEIISTDMSDINEPEKETPDPNSKSNAMPTYINTTESDLSIKTQSDLHNTSTNTDVNQQLYNNTIKDPVIEIRDDSNKVYHETKKFCKENEIDSLYENDRKYMGILEPKMGKFTDEESVKTLEINTLSNEFNLLQGATIDRNYIECSHTASNFMFKLSTPPSIPLNTTKFKFIIGTKKEDI